MGPQERKITFPADSILNAVIQDGDIQELQRLIRLEKSELDLDQVNHVGLTALHHAVLANNLDSVKILLNNGANVHVQDIYGFSPLHTAAALGFLQVTSLLVLFGADVFSLTKQSELPVDLAKDIHVTRLLTREMCRNVHRELFLKSYLLVICKQIMITVMCGLGCLFHFLVSFILTASTRMVPFLQRIPVLYREYKTIHRRRKHVAVGCLDGESVEELGASSGNIKQD